MGFRINDLQSATLPLAGSELVELEQAGNSRKVSVADLLPGFEDTLRADLASTDAAKGDNLVAMRRSILSGALTLANRTWHNVGNDLPVFATEMQGVDKSGATDSTTGLQNLINAIAAVSPSGGVIEFPEGNFKFAELTFPNVGDWVIRGQGGRRTKFILANDNQALFRFDDNYTFSHKQFENVGFYGQTGFGNGRGLQLTRVRETKVINCHFERLAYNVLVDRARGFWLSDISLRYTGTFFFHSTVENDYVHNIMVSNVVDAAGTDIKTMFGLDDWWYLKDVVNANMVNVSHGGLYGLARGWHIAGKTEGVFIFAGIVGWPSVGIYMTPVLYPTLHPTIPIAPQYCGFTNVGLDQPSVSSAVFDGDSHYMTGSWGANGSVRDQTGSGISILATAKTIHLKDCWVTYCNHDGITVQNGAEDVLLDGITFKQNGLAGGTFYDIRDLAAYQQVRVRDCSPDAAYFSSNNRIIAGNTSNTAHVNATGSSSTTAVTTIEDLRTFTIPANSLKPGQRVRIKAWGTSAANTNNKTVRLHFGSASLGGVSSTTSAAHWEISAEVWINSASTQNSTRNGVYGSAANAAQNDLTESTTAAIIAKVTGQNAVASAGDITCKGFTVEIVS